MDISLFVEIDEEFDINILKTEINNKNLLDLFIARLSESKDIANISFLNFQKMQEKEIKDMLNMRSVVFFSGKRDDVVSLYKKAIEDSQCDAFIKTSIKSLFFDISLLKQAVDIFFQFYPDIDMVTNANPRSFPKGVDVEVINSNLIKKQKKELSSIEEIFYKNKDLKVKNFSFYKDWSDVNLLLGEGIKEKEIKTISDNLPRGRGLKYCGFEEIFSILESASEEA